MKTFELSINEVLFDALCDSMRINEGFDENDTSLDDYMIERALYHAVANVMGSDFAFRAYENGDFVVRMIEK